MEAAERFSPQALAALKQAIEEAEGNEVFALGYLDEEGLVCRIKVKARGHKTAVPAIFEDDSEENPPQVFIHNHPSGRLTPSENDLVISSRAAEAGCGSYLVNNDLSRVYVIAEPVRTKKRAQLDVDAMTAMLEPGGAVAKRLTAYEPRQSQIDLVALLTRAFNEDALAAAEAGTGVGKSFAYLLPALRFAQDNNERVAISTATINLQQQLFDKDIPLVQAALGTKLKAVLVKGRGNYLCLRRMNEASQDAALFEDAEQKALKQIIKWAKTTKTGSRSDLDFATAESAWPRVCSEADFCMGMVCPYHEACFVMQLRRECAEAKILVVNHHLLFADLAARREGAGYDATVVLPPYRRVVIDEAHTVEASATSFFSEQFSRLSIYRQTGRLLRRGRGARHGGLLYKLLDLLWPATPGAKPSEAALNFIDKTSSLIEKIRNAADELDDRALPLCGVGSLRLRDGQDAAYRDVLVPALNELRKYTSDFNRCVVDTMEDKLENKDVDTIEHNAVVWEVKAILRRLDAIAGAASSLVEYREQPDKVMWLEKHAGRNTAGNEASSWVNFNVTPLDTAPALAEALFEPNKTVVCLSATLTVQGSFDYWMTHSGFGTAANPNLLNEAAEDERTVLQGVYPSPFPYKDAVLLACPTDAPLPDNPAYRDFVDRAVTELVSTAGGSALVLFTSYESMRSAYTAARPVLEHAGVEAMKQGDDDRSRLLSRFLEDKSSALFATDSFWEGVDAPGDTLRLVILCRLPFRAPNDPVFQARAEAIDKGGGSSFMELSVPEAVMKFKQGFGRLMRRSSDSGVVVVLDSRLLKKRYGSIFIRSIPQTRTCFKDFETVLRETERHLYGA